MPLPGAIDQDQFANAGVLAQAGGALRIVQSGFHAGPAGLGDLRLRRRAGALTAMAAAARSVGRLDAAERLADLVVKVAGI